MNIPPERFKPATIEIGAMGRLEAFRGTFQIGHTDGDARAVLGKVRKITGRHLAILWAFNDCWGLGGDSEMVQIEGGKIREAQEAWWSFLYEPDNVVGVDELSAAKAGRLVSHWNAIHWEDDFNLYRRAVAGEAL